MNGDPLGEIPPDHPWFKAIVDLVDQLRRESYDVLLYPPAMASNDARNYDAGRVSMAEDVMSRLRRRQKDAQKARAG